MEHSLKLQPKYFDYINNGTKRDVIEEFYTLEQQKQYGVLGIRIEKI